MAPTTAYQNSDSDSSTTKSAVEKGELIIRNKEQQKQDINELSRDTESANNPLKQIFDKQKELDKIETVELIKDIAQQAKSVMNKYDRIQAQNDVDKNKDALSKLEAEKAYNKLSDAEKAKYDSVEDYYNQNKDYFYYVAVDEQLKTNRENNKNLGGMGSDVSKGIDSAISIVTGIITGNITGGLAGASAPWVAEQIKKHTGHKDENGNWKTDDVAGNLIAHAILGAVVAELQGNSGLAGGAGAVTGELAAKIIREQLYGKDVKDLTEAEKENISALAQLATGLAVASVGGDVGDVSTGIAAGKNAVENNYLLTLPLEACVIAAPCKGFIAKKILEYSIKAGITAIVAKEIADNISSEDLDHLITLKLVGNDEITNRYLVDLADKYATTTAKDPNDEPAINNPVTGSGSIAAGGALGLPFDNEGYPIPEPLPPLPGYQPLDPEELGPNHTGHGGGLDNIEFPNHTGGNQIPEPLPPLPGYEPLDPAWINNVFTADAGKGTDANKPLDKTALETQHGKGNVEQGGGNYKETKDKIRDNQATNQKANESSKFGEHVKKEQEINAGKGTNSVTQADAAKYFGQERKYWSKDPIEFNGNKVYQRNDLFDPKLVDDKGRTNIQRMEKGLAPIGIDGNSINLHHMTQRQDGAIAEVTQSFHQQYSDKIHINPNTIPSGINRNQFNKWRSNYWKNRANDFKQ